MRFVVSTSALLNKLTLVNGVIGSNSVLPILEYFLFDIRNSTMTITATDLETSMKTDLDVDAKEDGRIAIPARMLLDTLKTLPEQPLTFSFDESTFAIEISSQTGKYKLAGDNPDEYPKIPVEEDSEEVELPADVLFKAINHTLFAVSNDELRPAMTGVYFQLEPDAMTFVATDASKLVKYVRKDVKASSVANFIVPRKALNLLKSSLAGSETRVIVRFNQNNAFFRFDDTQLICRLVDAKYPDYNAVIPLNNENHLTVDRHDFLNTLKRVSIFANKTTYQVVLTMSGSEMQIATQDLDFSNEADERLECSYEGDDLEIGFNARYLIEMLGVLQTVDVRMDMSTPTRAGILFPTESDEHEELLMLVMPVMLNS